MSIDENVLRSLEIRARRRKSEKNGRGLVYLYGVRVSDGDEKALSSTVWVASCRLSPNMKYEWCSHVYNVLYRAMEDAGVASPYTRLLNAVASGARRDYDVIRVVNEDVYREFPPNAGRKEPRTRRILVSHLLEVIEASYVRQWVSQASSGMAGGAM